jgi:hypothetical protein
MRPRVHIKTGAKKRPSARQAIQQTPKQKYNDKS